MRILSPLSLSFAIILGLSLAAAHADDARIKDTIFRDCAESQEIFDKLASAEQQTLIPFFREVLKLKIAALPEPLPALPPKSGGTDLGGFWQSFNPTRELDAKRCALKLLQRVGPMAFRALPEILSLAADPTVADDLAELIDEAVFDILLALPEMRSQEEVDVLTAVALEHLDVLGDNVLAFLPPRMMLRALWQGASKLSPERQSRVVELLAWLNPSGILTQEIGFEALDADFSPSKRVYLAKVLGNITCVTARSARYLRDLSNSLEPREAEAARAALHKVVRTVSGEPRCPDQKVSGSELVAILFEDVQLPNSAKPEPLLISRAADRVTLAAPLLQGRNISRLLPIIRALMRLPLDKSPTADDPAVVALLLLGGQSRDLLLGELKGKDLSSKLRAAFVVPRLQLNDTKKLRPFLPFLTDPAPEVRANIYRALLPVVKELRGEIRKLFDTANNRNFEYLAVALAKSGGSAPKLDAALLKAIGELSCQATPEVIEVLNVSNPPVQKALTAKAASCLLKGGQEACDAIAWISKQPAVEDSHRETIVGRFDAENPYCILNAYNSTNLRDRLGLSTKSISALLRSKQYEVFHEALRIATPLQKDDISVTSVLRELVLEKEIDAARRHELLNALGASPRDLTFWKDLMRDVLETSQVEQFAALRCLPPRVIVEALDMLFAEASLVEKPRIARMMGWFGTEASRSRYKLTELTASKNLEARYEGVLALLNISDQPQDLLPQVEKLLRTRFAHKLSGEIFPLSTYAALRSLPANSQPLQARLVEILRLRGAPVVTMEEAICGVEK